MSRLFHFGVKNGVGRTLVRVRDGFNGAKGESGRLTDCNSSSSIAASIVINTLAHAEEEEEQLLKCNALRATMTLATLAIHQRRSSGQTRDPPTINTTIMLCNDRIKSDKIVLFTLRTAKA